MVEEADAFLARLEGLDRSGLGGLSSVDAAALDALAFACARGGGGHDLALGEGLDVLARTGGDVRLGFSSIGDLARERLGIAAWQARRLRRNAVALRDRPLLRAAVASGEVSARKAEVMVAVAVGSDEPYWVERAKVDTVRRLEAAVSSEHAEEDWHRIRLALPRAQAEIVDGALAVAEVVLGPTAPLWKRLWAMAAEFLSTHPSDPLEPLGVPGGSSRPSGPATPPEAGGAPEFEHAAGPSTAAGAGGASAQDVVRELGPRGGAAAAGQGPAVKLPAPDPYGVLADLARIVAERAAADERFGRACLLVKRFDVARQLGWSCFEEWCAERLGLATSTVYQRIALERRLAVLPELREALRSRRMSYEQARLVARVAAPGDVAARIERAAGKTCIALLRDVEAEERLQMCNAAELRAAVPEDVDSLLAEAIRAARLRSGRPLTAGEALVDVARHFVETWAPEVMRLVKRAHPVILRDGGLCQIPGCSLPAAQVHHVWYRSAGGPLEMWNELSMCIPHHLVCVHRGFILIRGRAPDGLTFVIGEREVAATLRA